jgi:hypothetical protein
MLPALPLALVLLSEEGKSSGRQKLGKGLICDADAVGEGSSGPYKRLFTMPLDPPTLVVNGMELRLGGALGGLVARLSSASRVVTWAIVPRRRANEMSFLSLRLSYPKV